MRLITVAASNAGRCFYEKCETNTRYFSDVIQFRFLCKKIGIIRHENVCLVEYN